MAWNLDDLVSGVETCAVAIMRAQAQKDATIKPLAAKNMMA